MLSERFQHPFPSFFSSPEHKVLKVSYCDHLLCCASSVNFFSTVTRGSIWMKLHRKHPLNDLTKIPSNVLDPCRIPWQQNEKNFKILLLPNLLADFQVILQKCSLDDALSDSFKPCWFVEKHNRQGVGLFCLIWQKWKLKKSFSPEVSDRFSNHSVEMTHYQIP